MLASTQQVAPTQIPATNVHALGPIHTDFHYGILELFQQKKMHVTLLQLDSNCLTYINVLA